MFVCSAECAEAETVIIRGETNVLASCRHYMAIFTHEPHISTYIVGYGAEKIVAKVPA